ncbi:YihY/virulence factor BrkB family protein [Candidatus Parcubacteria bacterium]|nr:YihY/virulence factor BrkB family protein [Candidatus Parcubacteria bacterium]
MKEILKKASVVWWMNDPSSSGAALAFYTLFSLPALIIVVVALMGFFIPPSVARGLAIDQLGNVFGGQARQALGYIIYESKIPQSNFFAAVISILTFFIGALGVFDQLQVSLNRLWGANVQLVGLQGFMHNKVMAFIMIFLLGISLAISLTASTLVSVFDRLIREFFPALVNIVWISDIVLSLVLVIFLCMAIYAFLPHARISRRAIMVGGVITALLFFLGRIIIGIYLSSPSVISAYGAASAFIILMLWIYYSSQVFLFGAACTYIIDQRIKGKS